MQIRPARKDDFPGWLKLWNGYNAFYGRSGATALPAEVTETTWKRFFDASEPVHALVAELDARLVGLTHYLFHRSTTLIAPICYLQDLFVDASVRGTGCGRALIKRLGQVARERDCLRLYWTTKQDNATARLLYDRLAKFNGFIRYDYAPG